MKGFFLSLLIARSTLLVVNAQQGSNEKNSVEYSASAGTYGYRHTPAHWARAQSQESDSEPQVEPVIAALSDLDDIICGVSPCDFEDMSSNPIPEGHEFDAAIEGAKTFEQNALSPHDFFYQWVGKSCGADDWDLDMDRVFDTLVDAPESRASSRGCFQEDEKICNSAPDNDEPPTTTSFSGDCKAKRNGNNCVTHIHATEITSSIPKPVTLTKTCSAESLSQACYNYYSVIENYPWVTNSFTCTNSHNYFSGSRRPGLPATDEWQSEHANYVWRSFTASVYTNPNGQALREGPKCERDEFPPSYFVPKNSRQNLAGHSGQLVRWIPKIENGGGGKLWKGFCRMHDGGEGNNQYIPKRKHGSDEPQVNNNLVHLQQPGHTITHSSTLGGMTTFTTVTQFVATYSNAIFHMAFDWGTLSAPSRQNDWYLKHNPCWPKDIVPDNPGYVLLNDDQWYSNNLMNPNDQASLRQHRTAYTRNPDQAVLDAAQSRRAASSSRTPHRRHNNPPLASNFRIRDGLNITGGFPDDSETEVIHCRDAYCTEELKELGENENVIYIPGEEPTTIAPSVNPDTIPTQGASTLAPVSQPETRDWVVPDVPVPTGPA